MDGGGSHTFDVPSHGAACDGSQGSEQCGLKRNQGKMRSLPRAVMLKVKLNRPPVQWRLIRKKRTPPALARAVALKRSRPWSAA